VHLNCQAHASVRLLHERACMPYWQAVELREGCEPCFEIQNFIRRRRFSHMSMCRDHVPVLPLFSPTRRRSLTPSPVVLQPPSRACNSRDTRWEHVRNIPHAVVDERKHCFHHNDALQTSPISVLMKFHASVCVRMLCRHRPWQTAPRAHKKVAAPPTLEHPRRHLPTHQRVSNALLPYAQYILRCKDSDGIVLIGVQGVGLRDTSSLHRSSKPP
jgi:hypothetical protein